MILVAFSNQMPARHNTCIARETEQVHEIILAKQNSHPPCGPGPSKRQRVLAGNNSTGLEGELAPLIVSDATSGDIQKQLWCFYVNLS
jgi:hypothetical protein